MNMKTEFDIWVFLSYDYLWYQASDAYLLIIFLIGRVALNVAHHGI